MEFAAKEADTNPIIETMPDLQHVNEQLTQCFEQYKSG